MDFLEFKGKTKNDAITEACRHFSIPSDKLEYEVIEEGSTGFLGFGSKPAIIKARVKDENTKTVKKADPVKKAKLDENLQSLSELKDSVAHCEEVIRKNKDRYPVLEKNNRLISKQIDRINDDIKICEKAISYYNKKK